MKATILPIKGKYYGTEIKVEFSEGLYEIVRFTGFSDYEPSVRELLKAGHDHIDWVSNKEIDDGWGGKCKIKDAGLFTDHYEKNSTYLRALKFVVKINS